MEKIRSSRWTSLLYFFMLLSIFLLAGCPKKKEVPIKKIPPPVKEVVKETLPDSIKGRLLFHSVRSGNPEIYIIDSNGVRRLTDNPAKDERPVWSPDGNKIAFVSDRDGNKEIYIMDADGKNQRRLTFNDWDDQSPSWSPDGKGLVFESKRGGVTNLYIIDIEGGYEKKITDYGLKQVAGIPSWSPDGRRIVFTSNKWFGYQVSSIMVDGSSEKRLTDKGGNCEPVWSPDAKEIAFVNRNGKARIWLMDADGENKRQLTDGPREYDYNPSWSPDGEKIAYMSTDDPYDERRGEIFVVDILTGERTQITYGMAGAPNWHN
jgi:TolB protein